MVNPPETPALNASLPPPRHRTLSIALQEFAQVDTTKITKKNWVYRNVGICILALMALAGPLATPAQCQQLSGFDRSVMLGILDEVARDVQKHYYDHNFHGLDWDAKIRATKESIRDEKSVDMALVRIASALDSLDDSHTFFYPPRCLRHHDYGFRTEMVGDHCYIADVRPGSDAEAKGLKPGDRIQSLQGWSPTRDAYWRMDYLFSVLRPLSNLQVTCSDPEGRIRQVDVAAKFEKRLQIADLTPSDENEMEISDTLRRAENRQHFGRPRTAKVGDELMILNLPKLIFNADEIYWIMGKARKYPALVVDLRGNPGGTIQALKLFVGCTFDGDVKIAERTGRKELKPEVAKSIGDRAFRGKLIVLVDSRSASASELFARIVQLQKRGTVLGDRTAGRVMESRKYIHQVGIDVTASYGVSVTESDLIMSDGNSLEHSGVTPDEMILPSAADMASHRDPVLSRAAALLGVKLSPEDAGRLFPYEWPTE
jgi:C-terminal processing protease CtpA/Prc